MRHGTLTSLVFPPTISPIAWNGHLKTEIRLELKDWLLISYQLHLYFRCYLSAKPAFWRTILSDICESESISRSVVSDSVQPMDRIYPGSFLCPWNSPGRNMEWVAIPSSRILPIQGLNPGLLHSRWILYHLSHQGGWGTYQRNDFNEPRILHLLYIQKC